MEKGSPTKATSSSSCKTETFSLYITTLSSHSSCSLSLATDLKQDQLGPTAEQRERTNAHLQSSINNQQKRH
jgi:hypothetical protein